MRLTRPVLVTCLAVALADACIVHPVLAATGVLRALDALVSRPTADEGSPGTPALPPRLGALTPAQLR